MNKKALKKLICVFFALVLFLCGCVPTPAITDEADKHERELYAMDTEIELTAYGANADAALENAADEIQRLEALFSATREGSDVRSINKYSGSAVEVSEATVQQVKTALEVAQRSSLYKNGVPAFDITIYPCVEAWGFVSKEYRVPSDSEIAELLELTDCSKIVCTDNTVTVPHGMKIDLGGIAKGYVSSALMQVFADGGVNSAIVSLGGNVQALGKKPDGSKWKAAIKDPNNTDSFVGAIEIENTAIVTSGAYQRFFERDGVKYHHIFDPATGKPAQSNLLSVSVVCNDGTLADALSTALFVLGLDGALDYWHGSNGFDLILVTTDGQVVITDGIKDDFTPNQETGYSFNVVSRK